MCVINNNFHISIITERAETMAEKLYVQDTNTGQILTIEGLVLDVS